MERTGLRRHVKMNASSTIRLLAWVAVSNVAIHAIATVLLHWLVPGVDPLSEMVSAYLDSEYQWLSRVTFLAFAFALGALGLGLILSSIQGTLFKIAVVLMMIASIGFLSVAAGASAAGLSAVATRPATLCAILLISLVLGREAPWQPVGPYLLGVSFGLISLFVLTILLGVLMSAGLGGLANRVVLVLIYIWVLLVARGLFAACEGSK